MKAATTLAAMLFALSPALAPAADDAAPANGKMKEALRARLAEDARKAPVARKDVGIKPPSGATATPEPPAAAEADAIAAAKPSPAKSNPTVLPKVEVKKGKYSERDRQLALDLHAQDQAIERERKNLQTTETDLALNDSKIAKPLAIFGGESAQFRKRVAAERLELLEAEKDIIEQIAMAQTPEQKKVLQTQLDQLREMRRQLDKSLR